MNGLTHWLAEQQAARISGGLERRLAVRDDTLIDLAGNDYLGLSTHPDVVHAAVRAAQEYGVGAGASRLVSGTLAIHEQLQADLAEFTKRPAALALSTGYHANLAAVTALADADTLIVSDAHVHASLIDGCRLARGRVRVVDHGDVDEVHIALSERPEPRALVIVESVYSVLGDVAPLAELMDLCVAHDATLLVDEAHALGVAGEGGRGLTYGLDLPEPERLVVTATLSKALGTQGGVVLAEPPVISQLVNAARPFIFDTGLAPPAAGAARAAVRLLSAEPELATRTRTHAAALASACGVAPPAAAVLSVPMPSADAAVQAREELATRGLRVGCFRPPSVPDHVSRLRLTARASLADHEIDHACRELPLIMREGV
ncbi:MAG TPA: 8-amino-7-oxononanoate synthase [Nocardioidaceae bacterium]|nr:8-amino-7-oxononanoate synthase [Nocardioidaceae bacterium]